MPFEDVNFEGPGPIFEDCLAQRTAPGEIFPPCCVRARNHPPPHQSVLRGAAYVTGRFEPYEWEDE